MSEDLAPPGLTARRGGVLVVGSANVDVSLVCERLPVPGETVTGTGSVISVGGKGANQAIAAARCGAPSALAAHIGEDAFGQMVTAALDAAGVDRSRVRAVPGASTGLASILVDAHAQNCICVVPGANATLDRAAVDGLQAQIQSAAVVVLQGEIPVESVYRTIELAAAAGVAVLLNPAPYRPLDPARLVGRVTWLVPNETEAAAMCGCAIDTPDRAAEAAARLRAQGFANVVITLGERGCVVATAAGTREVPAHRVDAIDTTGAGDAFVGCLAAALADGLDTDVAIRRAITYAALSTTRRGAQASYASAAELDAALAARG
jgi:ribokinase